MRGRKHVFESIQSSFISNSKKKKVVCVCNKKKKDGTNSGNCDLLKEIKISKVVKDKSRQKSGHCNMQNNVSEIIFGISKCLPIFWVLQFALSSNNFYLFIFSLHLAAYGFVEVMLVNVLDPRIGI